LTAIGTSLCQKGKLDEAIQDYNRAIDIYSRLVEEEGREELASYLAMSLTNRGVSLCQQGKLDEAIQDWEKAVGMLTRLVEHEGRGQLASPLVRTLCELIRVYSDNRELDKGVPSKASNYAFG
jgi:tetratricopeptide (TPR) repeat protein